MAQPDHLQQLFGSAAMFRTMPKVAPRAVGDHQRREHVFQRGKLGQEVVELEDHAEAAVSQVVAGAGRQIVDPLAGIVDFALIGSVERAEQVQKRALSRAALSDNRQQFAPPHLEVHAAQHRHLDGGFAVALEQIDRPQLAGLIGLLGSIEEMGTFWRR